MTKSVWPVWHSLAQEDATNLCRKGNNQRSIRECPPMIFDYKNQTLFVTLIFQDAIHFIKNQHSSRGIKSHWMILMVLDFLRKLVITSTMQSSISQGESVEILPVQHCTDDASGELIACQSTFSARSPPISKFTTFRETKKFSIQFDFVLALLDVVSKQERVRICKIYC